MTSKKIHLSINVSIANNEGQVATNTVTQEFDDALLTREVAATIQQLAKTVADAVVETMICTMPAVQRFKADTTLPAPKRIRPKADGYIRTDSMRAP